MFDPETDSMVHAACGVFLKGAELASLGELNYFDMSNDLTGLCFSAVKFLALHISAAAGFSPVNDEVVIDALEYMLENLSKPITTPLSAVFQNPCALRRTHGLKISVLKQHARFWITERACRLRQQKWDTPIRRRCCMRSVRLRQPQGNRTGKQSLTVSANKPAVRAPPISPKSHMFLYVLQLYIKNTANIGIQQMY